MTSEMDYAFLSETELNQIEKDYNIVLWGAGVLGEKTINLLHDDPVCFIDNNPKLQGSTFEGRPVRSPDALGELRDEFEDLYLVICVQKFKELHSTLKESGFEYEVNCAITPMAREYKVLEDLRDHSGTVLFSNYDEEGGLYLYDFANDNLEKKFHGSVRGFTHVNDEIVCASKRGIHRLDDQTFNQIESVDIEQYEVCGITYDASAEELVLGNTQTDEVTFLKYPSLTVDRSISLSDRFENTGEEQHHINDIIVVEDRIFVLMFSLTGWWRRGVFDGGVFQLDSETGEILDTMHVPDVWMPHSLMENGGDLYVLDSMNGELLKGFEHKKAEFQGFVRGLDFHGKYCYVGQSLHRHVTRMEEQLTTQISPGIHVVDLEYGASHFVQLPELENIYKIKRVDWL